MARSADLIDRKVFEADFFLDKLANAGLDFFAAQCFFSAFVSSARSITFAMQAVLSDAPNFANWYRQQQERLRLIPAARFFHEVRNETQKLGHTPVGAGSSGRGQDGKQRITYFFSGGFEGDQSLVPDSDVVTACRDHLVRLLEIVFDCYETFDVLSPLSFYSVPNLAARRFTLEEMEVALGFPAGWTDHPGAVPEERLRVLRAQFPDTAIDRLFLRYLGRTRSTSEGAS